MGNVACQSTQKKNKLSAPLIYDQTLPDCVLRKCKDIVILPTFKYVYDEFFFQVDSRNFHCLSKNNKYLIAYSLDYISMWDLDLIMSGQNKNVYKDLNDLLIFFLYEHKSLQVKTNIEGMKMIFKKNKLYTVNFINDKTALVAFCITNKVEIYSITIKESVTLPPDVMPFQSIQLFEQDPNLIQLSTRCNSLVVYEHNEEHTVLNIYDTSKFRIKSSHPYGQKKYTYKDYINVDFEKSYFSSERSDDCSFYNGGKNHINLSESDAHINLSDEDDSKEENNNQGLVGGKGEKSNPLPGICFSQDELYLGVYDTFKKHKNKNLMFRYDGFINYKEKGRFCFNEVYAKTLAFSPDGNLLAVGTDLSEIHVYNMTMKQLEFKLNISNESKAGIVCMSFNPESSKLAFGTDEGSLGIIDITISKREIIKFYDFAKFAKSKEDLEMKKFVSTISLTPKFLVASIMYDQKKKSFKDYTVLISY